MSPSPPPSSKPSSPSQPQPEIPSQQEFRQPIQPELLTIFEGLGININLQNIQSMMDPREEVDDNIINFFMQWVVRRSKSNAESINVHALDTTWDEMVRNNLFQVVSDWAQVRQLGWFRNFNDGVILSPVHTRFVHTQNGIGSTLSADIGRC